MNVKMTLRRNSPKLLTILTAMGTVSTAFATARATPKALLLIQEAEAQKGEDLTTLEKVKVAAVPYIPAVLLGSAILRKRNIALAAAYTAVDKSFKEYRGRVVERFGKELDKEFRYNIKAKEVEETVTDEKGNEKTVKKTVDVVDPNAISEFAKFFDDGCIGWTKDPELNLIFLRQQEAAATKRLEDRGHLFLNEVYDMLGIQHTRAGQIVGWIYDKKNPIGDNYVDFGIYNTSKEANRNFVNGYERTILLDFNVDGNILDLM